MKKCPKCGIEKPLTEFHKDKSKKDGLKCHCKQCCRKYKNENKDRDNKRSAEWYVKNKDRAKKRSAEYLTRKSSEQPACIYEIRNSINNKVYIGETTRGKIRWREHLKNLRGGYHENYKLQHDFNEHGEDAFEWSIIKELSKDKDQLLLEEVKEIQRRTNNGDDLYNLMLSIDQLKMLNENKEEK